MGVTRVRLDRGMPDVVTIFGDVDPDRDDYGIFMGTSRAIA